MTCRALGDTAAALVDGELGHAARERAQAHLGRCTDCRAEVEAQRRLKAQLGGLGTDPVGRDLTARLLGLAGQPDRSAPIAPAPRSETPPVPSRPALSTGPAGPTRGRAAARPVGARRPARSARSARRRRTTTASALAVLSVGLLVALGGSRPDLAVVPVDPAGDGFVVDYVNRTTEVSVPAETVTADLLP